MRLENCRGTAATRLLEAGLRLVEMVSSQSFDVWLAKLDCVRCRPLFLKGTRLIVMIDFKVNQFPKSVILYAVFFYVRYGVSYRDLEEVMAERGVDIDHVTCAPSSLQLYAVSLELNLWR